MMMLVSIRYLLIHTIDSKNDAIGPISCIDGDPNDTLFELMGPIKDETPSMFEDVDADDFRLWKLNGVPRRSRAQKTLKKIEHIDFSEIPDDPILQSLDIDERVGDLNLQDDQLLLIWVPSPPSGASRTFSSSLSKFLNRHKWNPPMNRNAKGLKPNQKPGSQHSRHGAKLPPSLLKTRLLWHELSATVATLLKPRLLWHAQTIS